LAAAGIADDVASGPRVLRRRLRRRRTWNVVAEAGDPSSERTLVVLAHHDAAPSGVIFDPRSSRTPTRACRCGGPRSPVPRW